MASINRIKNYYQKEINYLFEQGQEFATKYPQIADKLALSAKGSQDPHVERLIESFAFLTAKLQINIDDEYSRLATTLVNTLYPYLLRPFPSTTVVQFACNGTVGESRNGFMIPRGTQLEHSGDHPYTFQTCNDLHMLPLVIDEIKIIDNDDLNKDHKNYLCLTLHNLAGPLKQIANPTIDFFFNGTIQIRQILHEIFTYCTQHSIYIKPIGDDNGSQAWQTNAKVDMLGFEPEQAILPEDSNSYSIYRLLQEYFHFFDKFMFGRICPSNLDFDSNKCQICLPISLSY